MTSECGKCGRPARDEAYACDTCGDELARALGDITWLADELETTITRQKGVDYRNVGGSSGGKKASERPSPVVWGASEARTDLKAVLVSWALYCDAENVRNSDPHGGLPDDDLVAISRYLMWRVDGLMLVEIGPDAVDEITSAVAHCHRLIDRPADRQFLGRCQECNEDGSLYARPGSEWATCDLCGCKIEAQTVRDSLLAELDDRLCTAAEIAHLSTYLGLKADREQVRKRINQWNKRGLIVEHPSVTAEVTFRFGEVYAKLTLDEYERKASA